MFETSVVGSQAVVSRRRYSLLSVSLVAHSAVILGAIAVSLASVNFPKDAPNQFELLQPVASLSVPPPLGTPEGNNHPKTEPAQQKATTPPVQPPSQQTAPSVIPAQTPEVAVGPASSGPVDPNAEPGTGPKGDPNGDPNSVATDLELPLVGTPIVEEKVYVVSGDVKAPRVISRVEPRFPQAMITARMSGSVTVHCTIDRNGAVRNVEVMRSTFRGFEEPVLQALPRWRFTPGSLNGRAVDTIFELTVQFSLNR